MSLESIKIDLVKKLFRIDEESVLLKIKSILDSEAVVGYTTAGKPLSKAQYDELLLAAEEDVKYGRTKSSEDLKDEVKSWRKS